MTRQPPTRERDQRLVLIVAVAITAAALTIIQDAARHGPSDFWQTWAGARALVAGQNPYAVVPPLTSSGEPLPLFYPLPALIAAIPVAALPIVWADAVFMAIGSGLLAWALTRSTVRNPQLLVFASFAWFFAIDTVQWSPLLTAAALVPSLGFLLLCKPTIGVALLIAYPSKRAVVGCAIVGVLSILVAPWWISAWLAVLPKAATVHLAPVTLPGGALILAALAKWRRPDARLLVALACVPHAALYEAVPLFLVVRRWWEGVILVALTPMVWRLPQNQAGYASTLASATARGTWELWLLYLPCALMVLRRPNVWSDGTPQ